ncbi:hypothetical protein CA235_07480 [Sphingomonas sp. ABOLF]|uniref:hypothetical protein n=1 Tax=Sphingomonas sp. ABOLF TaxID=1985879 RepID=UPI000F7D61FD|nr:hypothetical protein [Sphingomonas sp. ABOLF]RSV15684.1 hypothetical protein CA235_07480 [Sphingomonas sp. ABOLF]
MSYPTEIDAAIIYSVSDAQPPVRTIMCGIENVTINETANTRDRVRGDCAKPGKPRTRSVVVISTQWDVTGSGVSNADRIPAVKALLGVHSRFEIDAIRYDGTDAGELLGTFAGSGVLTAHNLNLQRDADSGSEVTIAGEDDLTWTPAEASGA